jgi:hypothetical protein
VNLYPPINLIYVNWTVLLLARNRPKESSEKASWKKLIARVQEQFRAENIEPIGTSGSKTDC